MPRASGRSGRASASAFALDVVDEASPGTVSYFLDLDRDRTCGRRDLVRAVSVDGSADGAVRVELGPGDPARDEACVVLDDLIAFERQSPSAGVPRCPAD